MQRRAEGRASVDAEPAVLVLRHRAPRSCSIKRAHAERRGSLRDFDGCSRPATTTRVSRSIPRSARSVRGIALLPPTGDQTVPEHEDASCDLVVTRTERRGESLHHASRGLRDPTDRSKTGFPLRLRAGITTGGFRDGSVAGGP